MERIRPRSVTVLAVAVLSLLIVNFTRFVSTLQQWDYLTSLPLSASPAYWLALGLIWSLISFAMMWGLLVGKPWALIAMKIYALLYGLHYWLELWLVKSSPLRMTNWPFLLTITLIFLFLVFWITSSMAVKTFFGVMNE